MASYSKSLKNFKAFALSNHLPSNFPIPDESVCLYITFLHNKGHPCSSISSSLSGINYYSKLAGFNDITSSFKAQQLIKSLKDLDSPDNRKPVTLTILTSIFYALHDLCTLYDCSLLRCAFLLAHTFALRLSEFSRSPHNLMFNQIVIEADNLSIKFLHFKHKKSYGLTHMVSSKPGYDLCVVRTTRAYLALRGVAPGPFFLRHGKALTPYFVNTKLKMALSKCNIDPTNFSSHSLRIGAASDWAEKGLSESQMKARGRWSSNALHHYVRGTVDHSS